MFHRTRKAAHGLIEVQQQQLLLATTRRFTTTDNILSKVTKKALEERLALNDILETTKSINSTASDHRRIAA